DMGVDDNDMMGGTDEKPMPMDSVLLGQIAQKKFTRMLFVFDLFEDRAFFLELLEAKEPEKGFTYPRVLMAHGDAPDQFDAAIGAGTKSIFDEAMDDYSDFDGDDNYDDEQ
ncbi:MAG: hypothetical protein RR388_06335, partial [Rikenellaceae bacterium]